jgi:hypothetical protein
MTYTRLLVLGDTHPPVAQAAHLASAGALPVDAGTPSQVTDLDGTALWVDTKGATRIRNTGFELPLLSPGPAWLATVPGHFLGRKLVCTTVGELVNSWQGPGTIRLAEQQYGVLGFEKTYSDPLIFIAQAGNFHRRLSNLVAGANVIASTPVDYTDRYRVFIANGEISASTRIAASPNPGKRTDVHEGNGVDQSAAAEHFAQKVIDATVWHQPPGFRIDVGTTADGAWQLISAGPSWAAHFHLANPTGVVNSILAGQAEDYDHWKWTPDELFQRVIFPSWSAALAK